MKDMTLHELTVEQNSFRLGYRLSCHLTAFSKHNCLLKQRKKLREQLTKQIEKQWPGQLSKEQKSSLLIPGVFPQIPFASVSISHCSSMGGFIILPFPSLSVGFDLEELNRAKENTVLRISNKNELKQSPSPSLLWSAKESAYKSINQLQNHTYIKQISIFNWQPVSIIKREIKGNDHLQIYDYQFIPIRFENSGSYKRKKTERLKQGQFKTENKNIIGKGHISIVKNIVMACAFFPLKK